MPIPQFTKQNNNSQEWRKQKKYYNAKSGNNRSTATKVSSKNNYSVKRKKTSNNKPGGKFSLKSFLFNKKTIIVFLIICFIGLFSVIGYVTYICRDLPPINNLTQRDLAESSIIYDRTGNTVLYKVHGDENRQFMPLAEIPDHVKWAVIAIEDKSFYEHKGISMFAIFRSAINQALGKRQGGSTLTQQFIKNAILTPERKIQRKIKEWVLAYRIEKEYSKDQILEMYLNEIPYGSTAYGVEAASQRFFGKSVKDINIAEAAILASIPQAPSRYSPYGPNRDFLIGRQQYVIDLMTEQGYITEETANEAKAYELDFKKPIEKMVAPHFVMYTKGVLTSKFNFNERKIEQGGYKIYTSLDLYKQEIAEEVISERADSNLNNYNAQNAALISIDPKTGQILAMVGSKDFYSEDIDGQFNVTTSARQPGSSIKPIVFAGMFNQGYTPDTILYDVVTNFAKSGTSYEPHNYDLQEHGPVTVRKALAGSLNIPAVKAMYLAGENNIIELAKDLGYTTLVDPDRYGLSLVLGGGEVKLVEHANAFSAFAREGEVNPLTVILKIEDKNGNVVYDYKEEKKDAEKVLNPKVARMINSILSDNYARAYAFGLQNNLTLGDRPVAAKTGTTNNYKDAWTIGYTPSIVTGVWVGNNDNSNMKLGSAGGYVAAPIWHDYMSKILGDTPIEYFNKYEPVKTGKPILDGEISKGETIKIDKASGLLATEYTPENYIEERVYRQDHSILYYIDKNNPLGDAPSDPNNDPQFSLWESRVQEWVKKNATSTSEVFDSLPPAKDDDLHVPENFPNLSINKPNNNETITIPNLITSIDVSANRGVDRVEYYINDNLLSVENSEPFSTNKRIAFLNNGFHNLKVKACDDIDNCTEQSLEFNLVLDRDFISSSTPDATNNLQVLWIEPSNNLFVNNIDFPLDLKLKTTNPTQTTKINIYYSKTDSNDYQPITTINPINSSVVVGQWQTIPDTGVYKVYAEAEGWNGELRKSEIIQLNITNFE